MGENLYWSARDNSKYYGKGFFLMSPNKSQTHPQSPQKCLLPHYFCLPVRTYLFVLSIFIFEAKKLKQGRVSKEDLQNISSKVQRKRKRVGRALGLDDDNLDVIEEEHRDNISEQSYQILLKWMQKRGTEVTYHALARALCDRTVMMKHVLNDYCLT